MNRPVLNIEWGGEVVYTIRRCPFCWLAGQDSCPNLREGLIASLGFGAGLIALAVMAVLL